MSHHYLPATRLHLEKECVLDSDWAYDEQDLSGSESSRFIVFFLGRLVLVNIRVCSKEHRKTIGKPWEHGGLMGVHMVIYHLVN